MARCKTCGKFGLFLKLNSLGECESCAAKRARQNYLKQGMEAAKEELENLPKAEIVLSGIKLKCRPLDVALRKESVDRNNAIAVPIDRPLSRSPQGERG